MGPEPEGPLSRASSDTSRHIQHTNAFFHDVTAVFLLHCQLPHLLPHRPQSKGALVRCRLPSFLGFFNPHPIQWAPSVSGVKPHGPHQSPQIGLERNRCWNFVAPGFFARYFWTWEKQIQQSREVHFATSDAEMEVAVLFHRWSLDSSETTANLAGKKNLRLALVATNQIVDSRMIWKAKPYDSVRAETKNGNKKKI